MTNVESDLRNVLQFLPFHETLVVQVMRGADINDTVRAIMGILGTPDNRRAVNQLEYQGKRIVVERADRCEGYRKDDLFYIETSQPYGQLWDSIVPDDYWFYLYDPNLWQQCGMTVADMYNCILDAGWTNHSIITTWLQQAGIIPAKEANV